MDPTHQEKEKGEEGWLDRSLVKRIIHTLRVNK